VLAGTLATALGVGTAWGVTILPPPVSPQIDFTVAGATSPTAVNALGSVVTSGAVSTWTLTAPTTIGGAQINSWTVGLKSDPFVTNNINVTNTTTSTQTFIASVVLPIPAFAYDRVVFSSLGVTTTDSNGNNVLSFAKNLSTSIYQGQVNAATLLNLDPPGLPLTTSDCSPFPGVSGCSATGAAGIPAAGLAVPAGTANSVGIVLTFDLSPGDSAGLTSRFEVVPEPATALLFGIGLVTLALRRSQRA